MTNVLKRLGYGGSGMVDGVQVLITSGSLDIAKTPSYLSPLSIPPNQVSRSRVQHADGTETYAMSLGFDVTQDFLNILTISKLFKRRYQFDVGFNDGEDTHGLTGCYLTSLAVSGAAGGLMTATLSIVATNRTTPFVPNSYTGFQGPPGWTANQLPSGYWYSGNTNVKDWSLTMTQEASPVYLNVDAITPKYIRVGLVTYSLQVSTYESLYPIGYSPDPTLGTDKIKITTGSFTLVGKVSAETMTYNGPSDLGGYSHTFETSSNTGDSSDSIIT